MTLPGRPRLGYRPALDGLRALAVLLVVGNHAGLPGFGIWSGQVGVTIFFVISGYLITGLLIARDESLMRFWQRRAIRLLPALFFMLAIVTPVVVALGDLGVLRDALMGALYVGNWQLAFGGKLGELNHLWTLGIEEQFYLLWPIVLIALRPRARWLIAIALGICAARFVVPADAAYYSTFGRADGLLFGAALSLSGLRLPRWSALAGLGVVIGIGLAQPDVPTMGTWGLAAASLAGILLVGSLAYAPTLGFGRLLPRQIGRVSYGLYIWDYPLVAILGPLIGTFGAFAMAVVSYRYVEAPLLRRPHLHDGSAVSRPAAEERGAGGLVDRPFVGV